jgi:hypothetical protein
VGQPRRLGFGTALIRRIAQAQNIAVRIDYHSMGLRCLLQAPSGERAPSPRASAISVTNEESPDVALARALELEKSAGVSDHRGDLEPGGRPGRPRGHIAAELRAELVRDKITQLAGGKPPQARHKGNGENGGAKVCHGSGVMVALRAA